MCPLMCDFFQMFPHSLSNIWTQEHKKITSLSLLAYNTDIDPYYGQMIVYL